MVALHVCASAIRQYQMQSATSKIAASVGRLLRISARKASKFG